MSELADIGDLVALIADQTVRIGASGHAQKQLHAAIAKMIDDAIAPLKQEIADLRRQIEDLQDADSNDE